MPVSLYGQPADMDEINAIAGKHGLPVIEDAAQSFGAIYKGRKSCNLSTIGCTSFFPSKPLGCYGDGGAIFTNDDGLAQAMREIRVHGQEKRYVHTRVGVGGRMDTLQCAVVLAKLEIFELEIAKRSSIGARYNELIDSAGIQRIVQRSDRTSAYGQYTVKVPGREIVQTRLQSVGIPTAVHYPVPLNQQPAYRLLARGAETPNAEQASGLVLSLPMYPNLEGTTQERIVGILRESLPGG
jgi:UDP-2-acetamido-2-deoxy-ribo-hexuluronate aminotransferase